MALSLNAVVGFNSAAKYQNMQRIAPGASMLIGTNLASPSGIFSSSSSIKLRQRKPCLLVANVDGVATETGDVGSENAESSSSNDQLLAIPETESQNGSNISSEVKQDTPTGEVKSTPRRSKLTAREKLRAARVLSRYSESKPSKTELGSKVLEVLRESDKGKKKSGLPEAPTNLFDDRKRGMPKKGLTFELPDNVDVFLIIFSVVFISTVMFTTTYIVWKVGAIHFNEY